MSSSSHSAASSALGYLYQSQWALLELLRRSEQRPDCAITLELHDDVAWEQGGTATELLQLKHHLRAVRSLGDKDIDVWRTIRAWMDTQDLGDPEGPTLTMVTTQTAAADSAVAALRPHDRNVRRSVELLEAAATESTAEASADTRRRFLDLDPAVRANFIGRVHLLDVAPTISDLDGEVRRVLRWALPRGHEKTFMRLLWAWWHAKTVDLLRGHQRSVSALDVAVVVDDLRDQFTRENLPTVVSMEESAAVEEAAYLDRRFVHQMQWVSTPARLIHIAVIDYYRSYAQTAYWIDDGLISIEELEAFQARLRDEWERRYEWMMAELPADADELVKRRGGLLLLRETLEHTGVRVRERYNEMFFCRGNHHELADTGRVGWHPDFADRVSRECWRTSK
ncbi:ABC-three component system protein [Micromonospora sp. NPDC005113]